MAKIVKSEKGYWVGKELYPQEQYYGSGTETILYPTEKLKIATFEQLQRDVEEILRIKISEETPRAITDLVITELCNSEYGMHYIYDYKCLWGVRKVIPRR